jgi:putative ABC transport system ATP-binding protein/macrolide transport system ATP-binding/permease protein/lipoprotein-releasing system ATP-binding protein
MLEARNLCMTYGAGPRRIEAVWDLSLQVERGEFLAVTGRSGSGKSTLLGMLGGLSRPTQGTVLLDGVDVWSLRDRAVAELRSRQVGFVFQFASLLPTLRAVDNVALPALIARTMAPPQAYARAADLLARVGLAARADAYPGELSGGEQRRTALARALINSPALLLADEPTGDLDEDTEAAILELLLEVRRSDGLTLIVVTHNAVIASQADRVVHLRQGRLAEAPAPRPHPAEPRRLVALSEPALPSPPVPVAVPLGQGVGRFLAGFVAWSLLIGLTVLALNQAAALFQRHRIDQKQEARKALEKLAMSGLRADVEDVTAGPDRRYQLTLYLWNVTGGQPLYVMAPSVRAFVQVGPVWQEVPLRSADGHDGQVLRVQGKQYYRYTFAPDVKKFEELMPGYMHVRFSNCMLVSPRSEPADDLVERTDQYYVYLKPHDADDAAITRQLRFPGKPPVWIPMPPH